MTPALCPPHLLAMDSSVVSPKYVADGPLPPDDPPELVEPFSVNLCRFLHKIGRRGPDLDRFLTSFLKHREHLPTASPDALIPGFADNAVLIRDIPRGLWASPLVDTVVVAKAARGFQSKRVLELGSYRGVTARLIAESTEESTEIWTVDHEPTHGEAYRGTPVEARIHRVVGKTTFELLEPYGKFDLIFVDAEHDYKSAYHDTICALKLLSPGGVILWHDYQNKTYLHGFEGVSEALAVIKKSIDLPIVSVEGTMIAIYSEHPGWETANVKAASQAGGGRIDPWKGNLIYQD